MRVLRMSPLLVLSVSFRATATVAEGVMSGRPAPCSQTAALANLERSARSVYPHLLDLPKGPTCTANPDASQVHRDPERGLIYRRRRASKSASAKTTTTP